jgi:hypothetical protein
MSWEQTAERLKQILLKSDWYASSGVKARSTPDPESRSVMSEDAKNGGAYKVKRASVTNDDAFHPNR